MDGQEGEPGREVAVPEEASPVSPAEREAAKDEFARALKAHFDTAGLSLRVFGATNNIHYATVSRYLTGVRLPERDFVDLVLKAAEAKLGVPVTAHVRQHLYDLHLAALNASNPAMYRTEVLRGELKVQIVLAQAAERREQGLIRELAEKREADARLRSHVRELEAAVEDQQARRDGELAVSQAENSRMREELYRLRERIAELEIELEQTRTRWVEAEGRSERLERELTATEEDVERDVREELRQAQERERARQTEESAVRASLADLQRRSEEREAELAHLRRREEQRLLALFIRRVHDLETAHVREVRRQAEQQDARPARRDLAPETPTPPATVRRIPGETWAEIKQGLAAAPAYEDTEPGPRPGGPALPPGNSPAPAPSNLRELQTRHPDEVARERAPQARQSETPAQRAERLRVPNAPAHARPAQKSNLAADRTVPQPTRPWTVVVFAVLYVAMTSVVNSLAWLFGGHGIHLLGAHVGFGNVLASVVTVIGLFMFCAAATGPSKSRLQDAAFAWMGWGAMAAPVIISGVSWLGHMVYGGADGSAPEHVAEAVRNWAMWRL